MTRRPPIGPSTPEETGAFLAVTLPDTPTPELRVKEALYLAASADAAAAGDPGRHTVELAMVQWHLVQRGEGLRRMLHRFGPGDAD